MGKRFVAARYVLGKESARHARHCLHEADDEPHCMKPYGFLSSTCAYRQLFQKKQPYREGNRAVKRAHKQADVTSAIEPPFNTIHPH